MEDGLEKIAAVASAAGKFLGRIARSSVVLYPGAEPSMVFEVPEQKMQQLQKPIIDTLQNRQHSARQLARGSIAGKLIAIMMSPALELAKLYSRCL
jgi:hypothetical protein